MLAVMCLTALRVHADDHAIGPGDRIDISVLSRPDLSRIYRVRLDGTISMHIVGSIPAAGRTPADFETYLEERLGEVFEGITSATVEVAEYRPVIVNGHVARPGSYPFQAGLDVAGALALAGGLYRLAGDTDVSAQMRVEAEAGRHAVLRARLAGLLVERARLVAERDGSPDIVVPDEARAILKEAIRDLTGVQDALRAARDEQLSLAIESGKAVLELATSEAAAYAERQDLIRRQLDTTLKELGAQQGLSARGLALAERLLDLRLSADEYRADELEAVALEAEARQRVSEAEAGLRALAVTKRRNVAEQLAALDADILEIRAEIAQARRFVQVFAGTSLTSDMLDDGPVYSIHRRGSEGVTVIRARPHTPLVPGDMVEVAVGNPALSGGREGSGAQ